MNGLQIILSSQNQNQSNVHINTVYKTDKFIGDNFALGLLDFIVTTYELLINSSHFYNKK